MSSQKKDMLADNIKQEMLDIVLSSDGDFSKMNIDNLINLCVEYKSVVEDIKNNKSGDNAVNPLDPNTQGSLSWEEFEVEQEAIYSRMNNLRMRL